MTNLEKGSTTSFPAVVAKALSYREVLNRLGFPDDQIKVEVGRTVANAPSPCVDGERYVEVLLYGSGEGSDEAPPQVLSPIYSVLCGKIKLASPDEMATYIEAWNQTTTDERDRVYQNLIPMGKFEGFVRSLLDRGIVPPIFALLPPTPLPNLTPDFDPEDAN